MNKKSKIKLSFFSILKNGKREKKKRKRNNKKNEKKRRIHGKHLSPNTAYVEEKACAFGAVIARADVLVHASSAPSDIVAIALSFTATTSAPSATSSSSSRKCVASNRDHAGYICTSGTGPH